MEFNFGVGCILSFTKVQCVMFSKKLFRLMNAMALFAMVFMSLAPSVSHALSAHVGQNTFAQEICTSSGKKITVQVVTTKGQQRVAEFNINSSTDSTPQNVDIHLEHCSFCANASADETIHAPNALILAILTVQAQQISVFSPVVLPHFSALPPPAQAPPVSF